MLFNSISVMQGVVKCCHVFRTGDELGTGSTGTIGVGCVCGLDIGVGQGQFIVVVFVMGADGTVCVGAPKIVHGVKVCHVVSFLRSDLPTARATGRTGGYGSKPKTCCL